MPFKNLISDLKTQVKDLQNKGQQLLSNQQNPPSQHYQQQYQQPYPGQPPQHSYNNQPPPVPESTRPGQNAQFQAPPQQPFPQPGVYWQPRFDPSIPVSQEWEHKQGNNNGWGNNEMENYTNEPVNSMHTPNQTLLLRAISQPNNPDASHRYTSARLVSHATLSRNRGSLIASLSLPCASGIWPAFWLLPREPFSWPTDGEVDIAETWNGDAVNHSCLHWGFYTPGDKQKHRVIGTPVQGMATGRPVRYEFAWMQDEAPSKQGRMVWWIDGVPVMKAPIPQDMVRRMQDFVVLLNVAMGGNVCQGKTPREGQYDFVVHELKMQEEPEQGGWGRFERSWNATREGDVF